MPPTIQKNGKMSTSGVDERTGMFAPIQGKYVFEAMSFDP